MSGRTCIVLTAFLAASVLGGAAQPGHQDHHAPKPAQPDTQPARAVNDRCPIQGEAIDTETAMSVWRGHSIGFCCPGCDKKWDTMPDAEKDTFLAKYVKVAPPSPAVELVRRFQSARAAGNSAGIDGMFLSGGRATVLHNGGDAGTWERYRDERLMHEMKEMGAATWRTVTEADTPIGDATLVRQTVILTAGEGARKREFSAAITLLVVDDAGTPKIAHMHWSSHEVRAEKK